jgi:hypothetical protein
MKKNRKLIIRQKRISYTYCCTHFGCEEDIPKGVVDFFDAIDPGDPSVPPRFNVNIVVALCYLSKVATERSFVLRLDETFILLVYLISHQKYNIIFH